MIYSFARIEAAVSMKVEDFYPERHRWLDTSAREGREGE
jgi:hypothetical protein